MRLENHAHAKSIPTIGKPYTAATSALPKSKTNCMRWKESELNPERELVLNPRSGILKLFL